MPDERPPSFYRIRWLASSGDPVNCLSGRRAIRNKLRAKTPPPKPATKTPAAITPNGRAGPAVTRTKSAVPPPAAMVPHSAARLDGRVSIERCCSRRDNNQANRPPATPPTANPRSAKATISRLPNIPVGTTPVVRPIASVDVAMADKATPHVTAMPKMPRNRRPSFICPDRNEGMKSVRACECAVSSTHTQVVELESTTSGGALIRTPVWFHR